MGEYGHYQTTTNHEPCAKFLGHIVRVNLSLCGFIDKINNFVIESKTFESEKCYISLP